MGKFKFRIAKPSDAKGIAEIHFSIRLADSSGIFSQMNKRFLTKYYKIMLNDPYEVVLCAENISGEIVGFNSCTLDAAKQMETFRKNKIRLGFASLSSILRNPALFKKLLDRFKSTKDDSNIHFVIKKGVRGEFWAWKASEKDSTGSLELKSAFRGTLRSLGIKEWFFEVDASNKGVLMFHKLSRNEIIDTIILPDGRKRYLMKDDLTRK